MPEGPGPNMEIEKWTTWRKRCIQWHLVLFYQHAPIALFRLFLTRKLSRTRYSTGCSCGQWHRQAQSQYCWFPFRIPRSSNYYLISDYKKRCAPNRALNSPIIVGPQEPVRMKWNTARWWTLAKPPIFQLATDLRSPRCDALENLHPILLFYWMYLRDSRINDAL